MLFKFIPAQIIIEIAKCGLRENILLFKPCLIFRGLSRKHRGGILENRALAINFLEDSWLQEFSAGFRLDFRFFKLELFADVDWFWGFGHGLCLKISAFSNYLTINN